MRHVEKCKKIENSVSGEKRKEKILREFGENGENIKV